jgi:predicted helicase
MLKSYLKKIFEIANQGDDREESYYSSLEALLKEYLDKTNKKNIQITTLPKKTEAGNPDFRIWDGKQHIVGYIEAKSPRIKNLDEVEKSAQLKRYLHTFPNVILTNFFEFRLYRNGIQVEEVLIARPFIVFKGRTIPPVENESKFYALLEKFFSFSLPKVYDARTLAVELAKRTRFFRDEVVAQELKEEEATEKGFLSGFYEAFRKFLISGLTKEDFADLYSQTITYGLFAARTRSENTFNRKLAYDLIPQTIGILKDVFQFISLGKLSQQMEWIVDDISEVLAVADANKILHEYFHEGKGKDPIVHFYETFLAEYDPEKREKRGVYYTPESVVSYIVRSLHYILQEHFARPDGFATDSVTVLDPAAGTLTFLAEAAKLAVEEFVSKYGEGGKGNFIKEHVLKNFYAFELMMAPYAVGHLKISFLLEELGYKLQKDDRFNLYLTNTLEMEELAQSELPGMASLSEESHLAGKVKKETPILVILGNPPYSKISANKGKWINDLLKKGYTLATGYKDEGYYRVDGKPLGEKKVWLQDDYVKFIRFAQWKIDQTGEGILGFITNHSYLDNPTFRGMRQSLMRSFHEIYVLDLHGNTQKKEKCPDGSKDENVFDIQQGVAIAICIKKKANKKRCKVYHYDIWGLRGKKNDWLSDTEIETTKWQQIKSTSPYYFFIPRKEKGRKIYEKYWKITDIFPVNVTGIVTARDEFVIDHNKQSLEAKIRTFINEKFSDDYIKDFLRIILGRKKVEDVENYAWRVSQARQELRKEKNLEDYFMKILYRPFDVREIFFHKSVVWRTRKDVIHHMMRENLGLITARSNKSSKMNHFFCSDKITEAKCGESTVQSYLFPLFLYSETNKKDLFTHIKEQAEREPNINRKFFVFISGRYRKSPTPEEIFYYIYAIVYSNIYRTKYTEFLKIDFPRIPFTKDYNLLNKLAEYGKELVDLHLLKSSVLSSPVAKFQGKGNHKVEKVRHEKNRVYINTDQYFEGVKPEVWLYQIGGYQVCEKWLKDRKGRALSLEDIKHYCQIVTSLSKTIEIQKDIDKLYPKVEEKILEVET